MKLAAYQKKENYLKPPFQLHNICESDAFRHSKKFLGVRQYQKHFREHDSVINTVKQ